MTSRPDPSLSRRTFLKVGAAGALSAAGLRALAADFEPPQKKLPIGIQLYTLRNECTKDFPGTVAEVGKMGYQGVDFAGYYGWDKKPADLRKLLDDNGLKCYGCHTGLGTLQGDGLRRTVDLHKALGNKFLIVPSMGGKTKEDWLASAKRFNEIAEKLKADEMFCGYHNHSAEFRPIDGETPWDIFFGNTVPEVVMQLDVGNGMGGGAKPVEILKKYPGRAKTLHVKGFQGIVGEDKAPWAEIFPLCESTAGTEWYIIEQDSSKYPPLECAKKALENMHKMGR